MPTITEVGVNVGVPVAVAGVETAVYTKLAYQMGVTCQTQLVKGCYTALNAPLIQQSFVEGLSLLAVKTAFSDFVWPTVKRWGGEAVNALKPLPQLQVQDDMAPVEPKDIALPSTPSITNYYIDQTIKTAMNLGVIAIPYAYHHLSHLMNNQMLEWSNLDAIDTVALIRVALPIAIGLLKLGSRLVG